MKVILLTRVDFLKQLSEGRLLQVYLFLGEERLFHEELLKSAVNKILPPEDQPFNFMRIDAGEIGLSEFIQNLETPPFWGGARLIYLDNLESGVSGIEETVLKGIGNIADGVYVIISALKLDGRKKIHQELQKRLNVVDCSKLGKADLPVWIKQRAEKMGIQFTTAQIVKITQRLGSDLLRIRIEFEKLKTFLGERTQVNDGDLDCLIPGAPEPDIFGLIDAVADRNPRLGLPRLEDLLNSGENEIKILATISRQFRNITAACEGRRQGLNPKLLASMLGINPYVAEKSFVQSGRFTLPELSEIMERLVMADYRMKTGQREPRLELELAVVEICTGKH
ncbi:MAG TPA: DNA polymerase III subunit delta, partial [Firmicutes bacterium]|jgi:DNA polymerase III subunit delta|nr:DNA polymerase III subunit delta [Bacillota bacterium]